MDSPNAPRLLTPDMSRMKYDKKQEQHLSATDNLHWGQRKLLMSEIEFFTNYYDDYDQGEKYVLYIGSADGYHINYLMDMFPELKFLLFDKRKTFVTKKNAQIFERYFTDADAQKYKNMNLFMICDIRNLDVAEYKKNIHELDKLIVNDMNMQKHWFHIINPKKALLKFRLPYTMPTIKYLSGDIYIQLWAKNASTETRLVPNTNEITYDAKKYEEQMFYFNNVIRRATYNNTEYNCIGNNYDCITEAAIIKNYLNRFNSKLSKSINESICDISISITIYLSQYVKNPINEKYLKRIK